MGNAWAAHPRAVPFRRESPGTRTSPGCIPPFQGKSREQQARNTSLDEGLAKLRAELDELINVRRAEVAARIQEAKEHGDISENAEYEDAKNEQAFIEGRIQALSALIKNAVIIDEHTSTTHVQIGSTVELEGADGHGDVHHRRVGGGRARLGPHLQRVAGRPRPAGQEEGRQDHRVGPGRGPGLQDRRHQLTAAAAEEARTMFWADELASALSGPQVVNDSKTPSGTVHVGSLRGVVLHDAIARALRDHGLQTDVPVRRRRPGPDGLPGAADARCGRPVHGRAAGPRAGARGQQRRVSYARYFVGELFMGTFAGLGIQPDASTG